MSMVADPIGIEPFRDLGEQHRLLGGPPGAGHAGFGVDHDLVRVDRARPQQWDQRKLRACRVAARIGDKPGFCDLGPVDLDQPVDGLFLQFGCRMLMVIPAHVGFRGEAKIRRKVDHLGGGRPPQQVFDDLLRGRMRQRAEHEIERLADPVDCFERCKLGQGERRELRKHVAHLLACAPVGGERRNRHARVPQEEPYALGTGVTGGAKNADFRFVRHDQISVVLYDRTMTRRILSEMRRGTRPAACESFRQARMPRERGGDAD